MEELYNSEGKVSISSTLFVGNEGNRSANGMTYSGGAIYNYDGDVDVNESGFADNWADKGDILANEGGTVALSNSCLLGNPNRQLNLNMVPSILNIENSPVIIAINNWWALPQDLQASGQATAVR